MLEPIVERCRVTEDAEGVRVHSEIEADAFGTCRYILTATPGWEFRTLSLTVGGLGLEVERRDGTWWIDGTERPDLVEAQDLDLTASPADQFPPDPTVAAAARAERGDRHRVRECPGPGGDPPIRSATPGSAWTGTAMNRCPRTSTAS